MSHWERGEFILIRTNEKNDEKWLGENLSFSNFVSFYPSNVIRTLWLKLRRAKIKLNSIQTIKREGMREKYKIPLRSFEESVKWNSYLYKLFPYFLSVTKFSCLSLFRRVRFQIQFIKSRITLSFSSSSSSPPVRNNIEERKISRFEPTRAYPRSVLSDGEKIRRQIRERMAKGWFISCDLSSRLDVEVDTRSRIGKRE